MRGQVTALSGDRPQLSRQNLKLRTFFIIAIGDARKITRGYNEWMNDKYISIQIKTCKKTRHSEIRGFFSFQTTLLQYCDHV